MKSLIEKGATLEAKTPYGQTPLYLAAMSGHDEAVRFLLDKGANTDVTDTFYKASMLEFVLQRKHYGIAKMIIVKVHGNADQQLAEVAESGQVDLVQTVLDKGKPSQKALDSAYEAALGEKQAGVLEVLKKAGAHEPAPAFAVDAKVLASYSGTYKTDQLPMDIKVFVKEGNLYLQGTAQPELALTAKSPTTFEFARAHLEVEFDSAASFTLKQGGKDFQIQKGGNAMSRAQAGYFVAVAVLAGGAAWAGDWPQFHGPSASGVGDGAKPPVKWDATKGVHILWSAEIPGLADSSPIVWGDRVFVTTAISSDPKQTFRTGLYGDTDPVNELFTPVESLRARPQDRKDPVATNRPRRHTQDQAPSEIVPSFADSSDERQSGGGVLWLRGPLCLFDRRRVAVEERRGPAECRMVLRSGFGVGSGELSGDP